MVGLKKALWRENKKYNVFLEVVMEGLLLLKSIMGLKTVGRRK